MIKMKLLTRFLYLFPDLPIIVKYKVNQQPKNKEKPNLGAITSVTRDTRFNNFKSMI